MDRLPDGRAPLTVLCGTSDPWCSPSAASRLAARWGGPADVIVVEGLGHLDALLAPDAARDVGRRVVAVLRPAH
jgi:pimeloyl-ACP methyl ester carboxylesterase